MQEDVDLLVTYLHLAWASARRNRPLVRCRFLLLAANEALSHQMNEIADFCRLEILRENPAHLVGRWDTLAQAQESSDWDALVHQLRRRYSRERAEQLLDVLGIDLALEQATYSSGEEYAASLLGKSLEVLKEILRQVRESGESTE
mgnify:CR=1 FL=1